MRRFIAALFAFSLLCAPAMAAPPVFHGNVTTVTIPNANVMSYGAKCDGSTDDSVAFSSAASAAATAGGAVLVPPSASGCVINTSPTFTVPFVFNGGGLVVIATGQTVTFNKPIIAPPNKIFSTQGTGKVQVGGYTIYAEWWGAKGDGITDDSVALNAALQAGTSVGGGGTLIQLLPRSYFHSSALLINRSNVTLAGSGVDATILARPNDTVDNIDVTGTSGSHINGVNLRDFTEGVYPADFQTNYGIKATYVDYLTITNVHNVQGSTALSIGATGTAKITNFRTVQSGSGTANITGLIVDGGPGVGNNSLYITNCNFNTSTSGSGTTYGVHAFGTHLNDLFITNTETGGGNYGFYLDGSTTTTAGNVDIHLVNDIADSHTTAAYYITGFPQSSQVTLDGGWGAGTSTASHIVDIESSYGVTVKGLQIYSSLGRTGIIGIYAANSQDVNVTKNSIHNLNTGIQFTGSTYGTIAGNDLYNMATVSSPLTAIDILSNSTNTAIQGNIINGSGAGAWTTGISVDNTSDYALLSGDAISSTAVTTPVSASGSNTHQTVLETSVGNFSIGGSFSQVSVGSASTSGKYYLNGGSGTAILMGDNTASHLYVQAPANTGGIVFRNAALSNNNVTFPDGGGITMNRGNFIGSGHINQSATCTFSCKLTLASGTATWTFGTGYGSVPACTVTPEGAPSSGTPVLYLTIGTGQVVVTSTLSTDSRIVDVICLGYPN